ncbi:MAG: hypothetical protein ACRDNF_25270 [Streptosporangiaceae bacterium]
MTAQPADPNPASGLDTGPYETIHLGELAAVVPMADSLRLRALERRATAEDLEDAEDEAALAAWQAREAAGQARYVPHDQVRRQLGLTG